MRVSLASFFKTKINKIWSKITQLHDRQKKPICDFFIFFIFILSLSLSLHFSVYSNAKMSLNNFSEPIISKDKTFLLVTTILWASIALIGILANICVIFVASCSSGKKSATHYFITNLAFSDMLFLLVSPTLALFNLHQFISFDGLPLLLGKIICKCDYYLSHVTSSHTFT